MDTARKYGTAPVAQWIRRLPTEQEILGSIPGGGSPRFLFLSSVFILVHLATGMEYGPLSKFLGGGLNYFFNASPKFNFLGSDFILVHLATGMEFQIPWG
jgi:hypothetical protein